MTDANGSLRGRSFIGMGDLSPRELGWVLDLADDLKRLAKAGIRHDPLRGKTLGLLFQKPSLRTRVSFELAMKQLGGDVLYMAPAEVGLGQREAVDDVALVLSRYFDIVAARVFGHGIVRELAEHATIPVINALSDAEHPCQALADVMTIREWLGEPRGVRVAFIGDGNNVAASLGLACAMLGAEFACASPPGFELPPEARSAIEREAARAGTRFVQTSDPREAAGGAQVLYTDVWTSMGQEAETERRRQAFRGFRVDAELVAAARDPIILHCLPAHYGEEITRDVSRGPRSAIWDQAENRLHAQKALIAMLTS